jgi:hypothetical protein
VLAPTPPLPLPQHDCVELHTAAALKCVQHWSVVTEEMHLGVDELNPQHSSLSLQ